MLTQDLITKLLAEGGFDVTRDQALSWLNERYIEAVAQAHWRRAQITLATTIAGQAVYPFSDNVVEIEALVVGSAPYDRAGTTDLFDLQYGSRRLMGTGIYVPSFDATGASSIEIFPVPQSGGATLSALVALMPDALIDTAGNAPQIPIDFHTPLLHGAIATGLVRIDEDLGGAQSYQQEYQQMVTALERRGNSRVGGEGPSQILVAGYHF